MNRIPNIKEVKPLDDLKLIVTFENNIKKKYDVKRLLDKYPVFGDLKSKHLFNLVHVDCGGYGIAWNDFIDLSKYEIWKNGEELACQPQRGSAPS
jgi:hypothetical protein